MEYTFFEELQGRNGIVSNLHGFFNRHLDGGFKTKWSGYWSPPHKFLDYYAVKLNGIWLGPENLDCAEYGEGMVLHYVTDSFDIREEITAPGSLPGFRTRVEIDNSTDEAKAVKTVLETGVDIRHKSEDIGPEEYSVEEGSNRVTVSSGSRKLMLSSNKSFELQGERYIKNHYPGERQRCLVPGEIVSRQELGPGESTCLEVEFTTSGGSFRSLETVDQRLEHGTGRTFKCCIGSMENLVYDVDGVGLIAGHPWFQEYWSRDTFWTLLGLIDAGHLELSEQVLENFVEKDAVDSVIGSVESLEDFPRNDGPPLFVIASDRLERHHRLSDRLEKAREEAMEELELDERGVVQHHPRGTWMDTLERPAAVDIQSLWLEAARVTGDPRQEELERGLELFLGDEYARDHLGEEPPETINPAVPLMLGQVGEEKAERYLQKINGEFSSRYGARTRSATDPGYNASGYHEGTVWGLTTAWAAAANFRYGKPGQGKNLLEKMAGLLDRNQPGALPELVDAETGELLGASEQAWSAGMFAHVVDSYLLGIEVDGDRVKVDPAGEVTGERTGKRIRGERLDLRFRDGDAEVLNDPGIEVDTG